MDIKTVRKYFRDEVARNKASAALFEDMLRYAFGPKTVVIVGHHLTVEDSTGTTEENIQTENEIPSADTFMFDHDIMGALFGDDALMVMQALASVRVELRDKLLAQHWKMYGLHNHPTRLTVIESTEGNPATDPALW